MQYIAGLFGALFAGVTSFFLQYFGKRFAIAASVVVVVAGFVSAFFIAIVALVESIQSVAPPMVSTAYSLVVPDNVPLLLSTLVSARVLRWAYEWNVKVIQYRLF